MIDLLKEVGMAFIWFLIGFLIGEKKKEDK